MNYIEIIKTQSEFSIQDLSLVILRLTKRLLNERPSNSDSRWHWIRTNACSLSASIIQDPEGYSNFEFVQNTNTLLSTNRFTARLNALNRLEQLWTLFKQNAFVHSNQVQSALGIVLSQSNLSSELLLYMGEEKDDQTTNWSKSAWANCSTFSDRSDDTNEELLEQCATDLISGYVQSSFIHHQMGQGEVWNDPDQMGNEMLIGSDQVHLLSCLSLAGELIEFAKVAQFKLNK